MKPFELFIVVQPGLEDIAKMELKQLGIKQIKQIKGALICMGHLTTIIKINLYCRCITRVLITLGSFYADNFRALQKNLSLLPWKDFIQNSPLAPFCFHIASFDSALYHENAIAERVIHTLSEVFEQKLQVEPSVTESSQLVVIHNKNNQLTVRLDSSGIHLHKRGYGKYVESAPLRETIAAGMIFASAWQESKLDLIDPMCGSGTIAIEAAMIQKGISWDSFRSFSFMNWINYQSELLDRVKNAFQMPKDQSKQIIASDVDPKALDTAIGNAKKAGVADDIEFQLRPLSYYNHNPQANVMYIFNPPWGKRLEQSQLLQEEIIQLSHKSTALILLSPDNYPKTKKLFALKSGEIQLNCISFEG